MRRANDDAAAIEARVEGRTLERPTRRQRTRLGSLARRTEVGAVVVVGGGWERFHVGEVDELLSRLVELIESNPHYLTRRDDDWWPARIGHDGDGGNGAPALLAAHTKPRRFD